MPRAIVRWGRAQGFRIEIVGVDSNSEITAYARRACSEFPEISILESNALSPDGGGPFDYAISSLCLHHLSDSEIVGLLKKSDRVTTRGLIMNDLKRSARAGLGFGRFLARLRSSHRSK